MKSAWKFIAWRMRWTDLVTRMGEVKNTYKILVEKPEGKSPLGRPRRRFEKLLRNRM
jgi:hypothetical protein